MTLTIELRYLAITVVVTALMWVPYILGRMVAHGPMAAAANPDFERRPDPAWARRARAAHANAIENLAVYAPLVLIASLVGISTAGTVLAAKLYLGARIVHYVVYAAGIPGIRTLAFLAGVVATLMVAWPILMNA